MSVYGQKGRDLLQAMSPKSVMDKSFAVQHKKEISCDASYDDQNK